MPLPRRKPLKRLSNQKRKKTSSIGNLIASGTSALLSYVPAGGYLAKISQIFFRNFGCLRAPRITYTQDAFADGINWLGMGTRFKINYLTIALNSPMGIVANMFQNTVKCLLTQYEDARLISVTISVKPMSQLEGRQGLLAISFIPFKDDRDEFHSYPGIPTFQDVMGNPGVRSGPAEKGLSLTYIPDSPWIKDFHRLDTSFGICQIGFYDPYRMDPTVDFPIDHFNAEIKISGTIQLAKPLMSGGFIMFRQLAYDFTGGINSAVSRIDGFDSISYADGKGKILSTNPDQAHLHPGHTQLRWKIPEKPILM